MKKHIFMVCLLIVAAGVSVCCSCMGSNSESSAESDAAASSDAAAAANTEVGNTDNNSSYEVDTTANVDVFGLKIETAAPVAPVVQEAEYTFAELFWNIYTDTFFRWIAIIFFAMWYTGNLAPHKNLTFFDKNPLVWLFKKHDTKD